MSKNLSHLLKDEPAVTRDVKQDATSDDDKRQANQQDPSRTPDQRQKDDITFWSGIGLPPDQTAALAQVSLDQLQERYRSELNLGPAEANRQVCENLFNLAVSPRHPSVAMFWAKARCGFRTAGLPSFQYTTQTMGPPRIGSTDDHARIDL